MADRKKSGKIDKKTIEGCCRGSTADFEKIFDLYGDKILNYIHHYIREDLESSKDLMQETFISVYSNIHKLKDPDKFNNWIYAIASNKCRDHLRKRKNQPVVSSDLISEMADREKNGPLTAVFHAREREMIEEVTDLLPLKLKEVFILRKHEKMSFKDISKITRCSVRTAKYRMKKALDVFVKELQKRGFDFGS